MTARLEIRNDDDGMRETPKNARWSCTEAKTDDCKSDILKGWMQILAHGRQRGHMVPRTLLMSLKRV